MVATLLDMVILSLTSIDYYLNGDADLALEGNQGLRLKITISAFSIVQNLAWNIV